MNLCCKLFSELKTAAAGGGLSVQGRGTEPPHSRGMKEKLPNKIKELNRKHTFLNNRYCFESNHGATAFVMCIRDVHDNHCISKQRRSKTQE